MASGNGARGGYDYLLLLPTALLAGIGLVMVYSASSNLALLRLGDPYYFLKRQAVFCLLGFAVLIAAKNLPLQFLRRAGVVYGLLIASWLGLVLLCVPGVGHRVGGACRWLSVAGFSVQPSEVAKLALAFYMAYSLSRKGTEIRSFTRGLLPRLLVAGAFVALILVQPDLGTSVIILAWMMILLFVGGARMWHLLGLAALAVPGIVYLIFHASYRLKRLMTFLDPWQDPEGAGFQIIHSILAFGTGGWLGAGPGNGKQKLFYLPEPHTDFIMPIAGEEFGFVGVTVIVCLFVVLLMRGIKVALGCRDNFNTYLALALISLMGLQVVINLAVVLSLLPTKGLTLPLMSYGGSSLVFTLAAVGLLLNISSHD